MLRARERKRVKQRERCSGLCGIFTIVSTQSDAVERIVVKNEKGNVNYRDTGHWKEIDERELSSIDRINRIKENETRFRYCLPIIRIYAEISKSKKRKRKDDCSFVEKPFIVAYL